MFKDKSKLVLLLIMLPIISSTYASDDDPQATCKSAAELFKEGDIDGALEEARWCVTQLEQMKQKQVSTFFKDSIHGYKGGKINQQQVMGMSMVERAYSQDGNIIKVILTGGNSQAAGNALSALTSFGLKMGVTGKRVRIQKRSATINDEGKMIKLIVTLKNGGVLNFESNDISSEDIIAFAKKFPVADLDNSRN